MQSNRTARVLAVLLLLGGCRSFEPAPLDPVAERELLTRRGTAQHPAGQAEALAPLPGEWFPLAAEVRREDGLSLAEANTLALLHAPTVLAARSDARLEGIQLLQEGLLPNPELFAGPRLIEGGEGIIVPGSLSLEIPWAGRRAAARERAGARLEAARFRVMEAELEVLTEVRRQSFQIAALRAGSELLQEVETQAVEAAELVERLHAVGEADALATYLARLEAEEASQAVHDLGLEQRRAVTNLLTTIGLLADSAVEIVADPAQAFVLPSLPPQESARLLEHPRILAAGADYRSAEQALRLEIARQYPDLHIGPEFESDDGDVSIGVGLRMPLPIFDRNQYRIEAAEESREAARAYFDAELLALTPDAQDFRSELEVARELVERHRAASLDLAEAAEKSLAARFRAGQTTVFEMLTARRAITQARRREVALQRRVAEATLGAAVAGGLVLAADPTDPADAAEEDSRP